MAVGLTNGKIALYDERKRTKIGYFQLGSGVIRDVKINPHERYTIAGAYGDKIAVFDIRAARVVHSCFGHNVI